MFNEVNLLGDKTTHSDSHDPHQVALPVGRRVQVPDGGAGVQEGQAPA